jgi:hypothetical protein
MTSHYQFQPVRALATLLRHNVQFVVIGGLGGNLHGSPTITNDIDICYARNQENFERLAAALTELGARLRGAPEGIPFILDAKTLKMGDHFTFATDAGPLDCLGTPAGVSGFEELRRNALEASFEGLPLLVASLDDIIRMKQAAGRQKDLIEIEVLGALQEEIDREENEKRKRSERPRSE